MKTTLLTPAAVEPLALPDAKAYLRVDYASDDDLIQSLIASARAQLEAEVGLVLISRRYQLDVEDWPVCAPIKPPVQPVLAIESVMIDGVDHTHAFELEEVSLRSVIHSKDDPPPAIEDSAQFTLLVGLADTPEDVPDDLHLALKMLVREAYEARTGEGRSTPSSAVERIIAKWREVRL